MDMSEVLLPQVVMLADYESSDDDNSQINSSSIYSYLNMRGLGRLATGSGTVRRSFAVNGDSMFMTLNRRYEQKDGMEEMYQR